MHVTARVDYALQAMVALAHTGGERMAAAAIAEQLDLSYHYLLSIIGELRRAGLVQIVRGPNGGLKLAKPAVDITLGDIILAIDGPLPCPTAQSPAHPEVTTQAGTSLTLDRCSPGHVGRVLAGPTG